MKRLFPGGGRDPVRRKAVRAAARNAGKVWTPAFAGVTVRGRWVGSGGGAQVEGRAFSIWLWPAKAPNHHMMISIPPYDDSPAALAALLRRLGVEADVADLPMLADNVALLAWHWAVVRDEGPAEQ